MKNCKISAIVMVMTTLLSLAGGLPSTADSAPLTPEYAARRENVRKQQEQRITPEKRKAAAEALKAERLRVYNAKQAAKQAKPLKTDNR